MRRLSSSCVCSVHPLSWWELLRLFHGRSMAELPSVITRLTGAAIMIASVIWMRRGRYRDGVLFLVVCLVLTSGLTVAVNGLAYNLESLKNVTVPLALSALLLGRRVLWASLLFYLGAFAAGDARDHGWLGAVHPPPVQHYGMFGSSLITFSILAVVLDRFGASIREGFSLALQRQQSLERATEELTATNVALTREMERRRVAEVQLVQAQKMEAIARVSGGVAHDFNNLLTIVTCSTALAKRDARMTSATRAFLDDIDDACRRGTDLVRQLLAFAGRQISEPAVVRVQSHIQHGAKMLVRLLRENIELSTEIADDLWPVLIDPIQLDQIIMNLAVNSRDAIDGPGMMNLRACNDWVANSRETQTGLLAAGHYVRLTVEDSGVGMDEPTRARIFEPFFTTKEEGRGTGLGLSTCRTIVEQAGGAIECRSEVGRGTSFTIYLPRALGDAPQGEAAGSVVDVRGTETVLVVEDEPELRRVVCVTLCSLGYSVLEADGAEQAELVERQFDGTVALLITDVVLRGRNGRSLADTVKARRPDIRVMFMSGYTDDAIVRRGVETRHFDLLAKPFTPHELGARVRAILDRALASP